MKKVMYCLLALLLLLNLSGCGTATEDGSGYYVYCTNQERTRLARFEYDLKNEKPEEAVGELLKHMQEPTGEDHVSVFPEEVRVVGYTLTDGQLTIKFNEIYNQMDNVTEILLRAAVIRTVSQVPEVRTVVFHIGTDVLRDAAGEPVGAMTNSQFINNPVGINSYQYAALSLYFSSEDGTKIVKETRKVHYSSNTTLEKVVMEQLQKGPMSDQLLPVLSSDAKVLNITVAQKMCTINFNSEFLKGSAEKKVQPEVTIYSIVNTLCDMLNVDRVQFQVEGDSNLLYADTLSLNGPFHRNSELIEMTETQEVDEQEFFEEPSIGL